MNIDNCLQCLCVKFKRPERSNWTGKECEIRGDGFITLPCSRSGAAIDGGIMTSALNDCLNLGEEERVELVGVVGKKGVFGGARGRRQSGKGLA